MSYSTDNHMNRVPVYIEKKNNDERKTNFTTIDDNIVKTVLYHC